MAMGIFEKNLIMMVLRFVLRWLSSNEKNMEHKKQTSKKKGE